MRRVVLWLVGVRVVVVLAFAALVAVPVAAYDYGVPLDPHSPWPKFRRDARQSGRSPLLPRDSGRPPWVFRTGKGIFSSPVIDADGTVYVGSADRVLYAINADGTLKWKFTTGEIIDSAALLDDQQRVIFGSGDGHVYALERATGALAWSFAADPPALNSAFINWFEGNVAIGADGALYAPNDNFCTYALGRANGERLWCFETRDQTWSLPAVDARRGSLFVGNNFAFFGNVAALGAADGHALWHASADGSVAASPLLASADNLVVVGAFDGYVRGYDPDKGGERWRFGARDHVYASPAEMADGTIVQPGADGSIYAIDPADGSLRWAFDTREPIRSSPAVDGDGNIYVGSGEGRLFVLNPNGSLRWSLRLIDDPRDDLNASPALGETAIVLGGENGGVFSVPYDYCLRPGLDDPRCSRAGEGLADDGASLLYTTSFGRLLDVPPAQIDANQPLTLSLLVRRRGDTQLALLDAEHLTVSFEPPLHARVDVSGDRKFITIVPRSVYPEGILRLRVQGNYLVSPQRHGLRFTGGTVGGKFDQAFEFTVRPHPSAGLHLDVPRQPGEHVGGWELYRLAAPLPTILPSYNQIGFDSIHYRLGLVEGDATHAIAWAVGGELADVDNRSLVDPHSRVRFPLEVQLDGELLTMTNEAGFTIEFNGFPLPFQYFRVATRLDENGAARYSPALNSLTTCGDIDFYGEFLQTLGYCNPSSDVLDVVGAAELRPLDITTEQAPGPSGEIRFDASYDRLSAVWVHPQLRADAHNFGLLAIDATSGRPLALPYVDGTTAVSTNDGLLAGVTLTFPAGAVPNVARVYAMVDTQPVAMAQLSFPSVPWHARMAGGLRWLWDAGLRVGGRIGRVVALRVARLLN